MSPESTPVVASARWSCRIALFSVSLLLVTLVLHRLVSFSTPLAINLFAVGFAGAVLAVLIGLVALVRIWVTGDAGAGSMAVGILLPLLALAGPLVYAGAFSDLPPINDVTTDAARPPSFTALARRPDGANPIAYPGQQFAALQTKAYPDLRPLVLERSAEEAFELVEEAVRRLRWRIVAEVPPAGERGALKVGRIEATEQTLLVGFTDDVVIRIEGGPTRARVDARSASRYGRYDFGQNADRLRRLFTEVQARAEATPAAAAAARQRLRRSSGGARTILKRQKARDRRKAEPRNARGPAK